jgi:hypothetical protein
VSLAHTCYARRHRGDLTLERTVMRT